MQEVEMFERRGSPELVGRFSLLRIPEDEKAIALDDYADLEGPKRYFKNRLGGLGQYYFGPLRDPKARKFGQPLTMTRVMRTHRPLLLRTKSQPRRAAARLDDSSGEWRSSLRRRVRESRGVQWCSLRQSFEAYVKSALARADDASGLQSV